MEMILYFERTLRIGLQAAIETQRLDELKGNSVLIYLNHDSEPLERWKGSSAQSFVFFHPGIISRLT